MPDRDTLDQPSRPTMRDVAALAGVSLKTVSRVINGMPSVDPELTNQVRRAAALLNYQPNLTASSLRRRDGRSMMIGSNVRTTNGRPTKIRATRMPSGV